MCFSATASFVAAGVTGLVGAACVARVSKPADLPLAGIPLFFAAQQAVEGALWLTLPVAPEGAVSSFLTLIFLLFAKVFWPFYAPLAVLLVETEAARRRVLAICCFAGGGVSLFFLGSIMSNLHDAHILGGHIVYSSQPRLPRGIGLAYLVTTGIAPMFSCHRGVQLLGLIVTAGSVITYIVYWEAFVSVWCFFAAASSVVILTHFTRARQAQQLAA
jgi:hypothetical protein